MRNSNSNIAEVSPAIDCADTNSNSTILAENIAIEPEVIPPRTSPSPIASLTHKLGLDRGGTPSEGRWWMERNSKPYFPRKMKKREKQRMAGLAGSGENIRPGTSHSAVSGVSGVSAVSGITVGSSASSGPRKEVPEGLKKRLKRPEEMTDIASLEPGAKGGVGTHRPQLRRGAMYTQQWVRGIPSPIASQIDSPRSAPASSGPAVALSEKALNIIREESATPVWLAEERSRLLIDRGKCLLLLRAVRKMDDPDIADNTDPAVGMAQKELEIVEEKLRIIQDKIARSRGNALP